MTQDRTEKVSKQMTLTLTILSIATIGLGALWGMMVLAVSVGNNPLENQMGRLEERMGRLEERMKASETTMKEMGERLKETRDELTALGKRVDLGFQRLEARRECLCPRKESDDA